VNLITQPLSERALGDFLQAALNGEMGEYTSFQAAIAFVKRSGTQHIFDELRGFVERGGHVRIVVGVDQHGTSIEGLSDLLDALGDQGEVWVYHDETPYVTFHPKLYLFEGVHSAVMIVGSGNLTQGGLYLNDEASAVFSLHLQDPADLSVLEQVKAALDGWCNAAQGTAHLLDAQFVRTLAEADYIRPESQSRPEGDTGAEPEQEAAGRLEPEQVGEGVLFRRGPTRRRPMRRKPRPTLPREVTRPPAVTVPSETHGMGFVMTLMRTDVGVGQTTPGTARRSPEIFVPLAARDAEPEFWGWPDLFTEDAATPGKFDRRNVPMRLAGEILSVNMMTWPVKHDFRLRSETLRSAGNIGDVLRIEQADEGLDYAYHVEIVPKGTSEYDHYHVLCVNSVQSSRKEWGYYDY
jgi:HKD family nuclease